MGAVLSLIVTIFAVAGGLGGAIGILTASRQKSTVETLAKDNDALRGRVQTLESTEQECQKRLGHLEAANRMLTETVTSAAKVDALATVVAANHSELTTLLRGTR